MAETPENPIVLEEGSAEVTLNDVYLLFYALVKQNQTIYPNTKMCFDLKVLANSPKRLRLKFQREGGHLCVWVPKEKAEKKEGNIIIPKSRIITPN